MTQPAAPSARTRVRRAANRASYEDETLKSIIDAAYVCHVAFADEEGAHCIPTACWRSGEHLYIHGSNGSRMLKALLAQDACVTITHLDGLVMARSAFNHSMNYRSAMIYGRFELVEGDGKHEALAAFMEHLAPGRQQQSRPGNEKEYAATTVLRVTLDEAVCKVRTGGPKDDDEDMALPVWAGVLPLVQQRAAPVRDPACSAPAPDYVVGWSLD